MEATNKMQMTLAWQNLEMLFIVDKIEIPIYDDCTPSDHDILAKILNPRIKRYDKIDDTKLYLDKDYMNEHYPHIHNNAGIKFYVKIDNNITIWFNSCFHTLSHSAPKMKDVVANGILSFDNTTKDIKNAYIASLDNEYCEINADF